MQNWLKPVCNQSKRPVACQFFNLKFKKTGPQVQLQPVQSSPVLVFFPVARPDLDTLDIYTVWTQRKVSGHNPTISRQPKCVNWPCTQFRLRGMCLETIPEFPASKDVWIVYLHSSDLEGCVWTQSNNFQPPKMWIVSRHNSRISRQQKICELAMYTVRTQRNVSRHNARVSRPQKCVNHIFKGSDPEDCVWRQSNHF